jgi:hypothetical protein
MGYPLPTSPPPKLVAHLTYEMIYMMWELSELHKNVV